MVHLEAVRRASRAGLPDRFCEYAAATSPSPLVRLQLTRPYQKRSVRGPEAIRTDGAAMACAALLALCG